MDVIIHYHSTETYCKIIHRYFSIPLKLLNAVDFASNHTAFHSVTYNSIVRYKQIGQMRLNKQTETNKTAWEYHAYEFWQKRDGTPAGKAKQILKDPRASLKKHQEYFHGVEGLNVANLCGSNGRKAVPQSLMGVNVTIFDVSEENRRYALELTACAQTRIDYVLGDVYDLDVIKYEGQFNFLYLEGAILHYFDNLKQLCTILYSILKPGEPWFGVIIILSKDASVLSLHMCSSILITSYMKRISHLNPFLMKTSNKTSLMCC